MTTKTYTGYSVVTASDFTLGAYESIAARTVGSVTVTESVAPPGKLTTADINIEGSFDYTGYVIDGYPVLTDGSAFRVYHDGGVAARTSGSYNAVQIDAYLFPPSAIYSHAYAADNIGQVSNGATNSGSVAIFDETPDNIAGIDTANEITLSLDASSYHKVAGYDNSNNDVLVTDGVGNFLLLTNNDYSTGHTPTLITSPGNDYTYCFLTGTQIATPHGAVAVETLQVGDEVITHSGATAKVRFNFIQQHRNHFFINKENTYPICIQANALADNVPSRDLYVTADHAIYFPEWNFFVEASILAVIVNDTSIYPVQQMPETFTYYHILCDNQEIVLAENTPAETFIDNVSMETFDNYAEYAALYPEEHVMEEIDIPRGKSERPLPRAFKQNLLDRAQQMYPVAQAA